MYSTVGAALASLCNQAAELLEKEGMTNGCKDYRTANIIYELLLLSPFLPHRRSRWYTRLCVNITHIHLGMNSDIQDARPTRTCSRSYGMNRKHHEGHEEDDQTYHTDADDENVDDIEDLTAQESSDVVLDDASRVRLWVHILRTAERALSDSAVTVRELYC
jgi:hypothetical protein